VLLDVNWGKTGLVPPIPPHQTYRALLKSVPPGSGAGKGFDVWQRWLAVRRCIKQLRPTLRRLGMHGTDVAQAGCTSRNLSTRIPPIVLTSHRPVSDAPNQSCSPGDRPRARHDISSYIGRRQLPAKPSSGRPAAAPPPSYSMHIQPPGPPLSSSRAGERRVEVVDLVLVAHPHLGPTIPARHWMQHLHARAPGQRHKPPPQHHQHGIAPRCLKEPIITATSAAATALHHE
jgi:hypothetical protein